MLKAKGVVECIWKDLAKFDMENGEDELVPLWNPVSLEEFGIKKDEVLSAFKGLVAHSSDVLWHV
eukprot:6824464-Karenia_brevis.AAC.1